jgi:molybdate transport system regulatory protein
MDVDVKLRVRNRRGEAFLGPGPAALLQSVDAAGSIHGAAKRMDMSYAKALRLVNEIESNTGRKIVVRRTGGPGGGGSTLTPFARELLRAFEALRARVESFAQEEFTRDVGAVLGTRKRRR